MQLKPSVEMNVPNPISRTPVQMQEEIVSYGSWFHNMRVGGILTAPDHFLGDYPAVKWRHIEKALPSNLEGKSVLDIGCNAGFYAQKLAERGALRVLGIDTSDHYLSQARFAANVNEMDIEFRKLSVYQLDQIDEAFDIVLFLGVFYHLRYPLFALDKVVEKVNGQLFFQSLLRPRSSGCGPHPPASEHKFEEQAAFTEDKDFPRMHFIERSFADDPTNWWLPNAPCVEAMLRSAGLHIIGHLEDETWICEPDPAQSRGYELQESEMAGLRG